MRFKRHQVHDLQVRNPKLGQNVHIHRCHGERLVGQTGVLPRGCLTEETGDESVIPPLHVEVGVERDGEVLVRYLQRSRVNKLPFL